MCRCAEYILLYSLHTLHHTTLHYSTLLYTTLHYTTLTTLHSLHYAHYTTLTTLTMAQDEITPEDTLLILASDGVWEFITSQVTVMLLRVSVASMPQYERSSDAAVPTSLLCPPHYFARPTPCTATPTTLHQLPCPSQEAVAICQAKYPNATAATKARHLLTVLTHSRSELVS